MNKHCENCIWLECEENGKICPFYKEDNNPEVLDAQDKTFKLMEPAGYNDHDGGFERCPYCKEVYNGYERIAMNLNNKEPFKCRKCGNLIAFRP